MGPTVRLNHDYCIFMREDERRSGLHDSYGGDHWYNYRNGVSHNGLSVVTYFLSDAPKGTGGFACVPGSHKSNCSVGDLPPEVRSFEWNRHYSRATCSGSRRCAVLYGGPYARNNTVAREERKTRPAVQI